MRCAWKELLAILPAWMRQEVDRLGRATLQELRLRMNAPPELVMEGGNRWLARTVAQEDICQCVNNASRYSPWSTATVKQGYITAPGGHRIGLCGESVCGGAEMHGIRNVTSLCIRIARDFPGIAGRVAEIQGSVLVLGAPGWGKTTLLRDLIRQLSDRGEHTAVVDERGELFPPGGAFSTGKCTDILTGCSKAEGIEAVLRTMGPECIAVDEVTAQRDCEALLHAGGCGVRLLATAHAGSFADFRRREIYKPLCISGVFTTVLVMKRDKSYSMERMGI